MTGTRWDRILCFFGLHPHWALTHHLSHSSCAVCGDRFP